MFFIEATLLFITILCVTICILTGIFIFSKPPMDDTPVGKMFLVCLFVASGLIIWNSFAKSEWKKSKEIIYRDILLNEDVKILYYVGHNNKLVTLEGTNLLLDRKNVKIKITVIRENVVMGRHFLEDVTTEYVPSDSIEKPLTSP